MLLGPAGIGIGIREVEGGAGDEAEKRSDELEGIRGRELGNEVVERVSVSDSELVSRGKFESSATVDPELADLESVFEEETRSDGGVKVSVMGAVGAQIDHFFFCFFLMHLLVRGYHKIPLSSPTSTELAKLNPHNSVRKFGQKWRLPY